MVVPGITGSALSVEDKPVWGLSGRAIMGGVISLGRRIDRLKLPEGFGASLPEKEGEGEPPDGVKATGLMPDLHVIPGMWSPIKGYAGLVRFFADTFTATPPAGDRPGNLIEFPYDWRLSNAVSARRLAAVAMPALDNWRKHSGQDDAQLVLVCHSMGGLVARWFLEVLGGWERTRWLITIGTPYQGSVKALDALSNGLSKGLGPFRKDLTGLVQSFPSMYELLPTYPCFDAGGGALQALGEAQGLGLNTSMLKAATTFHEKLAAAVSGRTSRGYETVAIKGVRQPTFQTARASSQGLELLQEREGCDHGGDGTVPRPSAHPPEWRTENGGPTIGASQRHATLQETSDVYTQLFTKLTSDQLGQWMGGQDIGIAVPELLRAGEALTVAADSDDEAMALQATVTLHDDPLPVAGPELMTNLGDGRYQTTFPDLGPGTYQISVGAAGQATAADPVSDISVIWDDREQ